MLLFIFEGNNIEEVNSQLKDVSGIKDQIKLLFDLICADKNGFELEWRAQKILELLYKLEQINSRLIDVQIVAFKYTLSDEIKIAVDSGKKLEEKPSSKLKMQHQENVKKAVDQLKIDLIAFVD